MDLEKNLYLDLQKAGLAKRLNMESQNNPYEPELSPEIAQVTKGLRKGWTTGSCAAAAAKAAAVGLVGGKVPDEIEITLPNGKYVAFKVEPQANNKAVVVKDAGDDPDCTDGARMTAEVKYSNAPETTLIAGSGIGTVTMRGLGIEIGQPAITPVPKRMILSSIQEVTSKKLEVVFSVPNGEQMAEKTTNSRLGIIGGISILGTTGIVRPFSTASYRASIVQQIQVAAAQGQRCIVLSTGARSESVAMGIFPDLAQICFIEVGDFTGVALRKAAGTGFEKAIFVGMAGKITKLAAGIMMTHYKRSKVDGNLMAEVARDTNAPNSIIEAATETDTARYFYEVCLENNFIAPLQRLCSLAKQSCETFTSQKLAIEVFMVDFEGEKVIASA